MASMFDTIADMLRGSAPDDLAHALGTDRTQTRRAMEIGLPALITGLRDKTLEPGGASSLADLVGEDTSSLPDDVDAYLGSGDPSQGAAMLDVAFGDRGEPALAALSSASGLSTRLLAQVMSVLAPLATGVMRANAPGDADGLRAYLSGAVDDLETKGFGRVVELVSPDDSLGAAPIEVVETARGPAELDVTVDELEADDTVVQGAFPSADDLVDLPEVEVSDDLQLAAGDTEVHIPAAVGAAVSEDDAYLAASYEADLGEGETPIVEPNVSYDEGNGLSAMGWLWWLIGALLALLLLLFAISRCGDDGGEVADDSTSGQTVTSDDAVATPTPDPLIAQRQALLDDLLVDYPGVTGEVVGEVAVLRGSVADQRTLALLDGEVRAAGLGVQNNVTISEAAAGPAGYSLNDLIAAQPELSTLRALLDQAGLGSALDGNGPFTLFAPTNDAFAAIESELADVVADRELLSAYLQYHLLSGEQTGDQIAASETLQSLSGETIDVSIQNNAVRLNDFVPVLVADAPARNGIMHVVSGVLVPPSSTPVPEELGEALGLQAITFDTGSSNLTDAGRTELDKVVAYLLETPISLEIGGHTDSDGDPGLNQRLSQERADAVKEYLSGQGVPADSLTAVGFGEDSPVAPNDTAANKALNRRIEFRPTG